MKHRLVTSKRGQRKEWLPKSTIVPVLLLIVVFTWSVSGSIAWSTPRAGETFGADSPQWIQRTVPSGGSPIRSIHVGKGSPQSVSVAVSGSSTLYSSQNGGAGWTGYSPGAAQPFCDLAGSGSTFFALDDGSNVYRSTDRGAAWSPVSVYGNPVSALDTGAGSSSLVLATGGPGLDLEPAYSTDSGASWHDGTGPASNWSATAGDPTTWNAFYAARAATTPDSVASSTDGGSSWTDCAALPLAVHVTSIGVFPNGGPLIITTDTPGASPVYRSNDRGTTWTASATGITTGEVSLASCVSNAPVGYVTTDKAVYASYDSGTTWYDVSSNLPEKQYTAISASGGASNTVFVGASDGTLYRSSSPFISSIAPATGSPGEVITVNGLSFGSAGAGSGVYFAGVEAASYVSWSDTLIKVRVPDLAMSGSLYVVTPQGSSNSVTFTLETPTPGSYNWYLAEGCTGSDSRGGFETWVLVQNPGSISADVTVTFMTEEGLENGPTLTVPPDSRSTICVADFVPDTWSVSTTLTSTRPVTAERSVYWNATDCFRQAATDSIGITSASREWYLAEGCTGVDRAGTFETWVLVLNPTDHAAGVSLTYMTPSGPLAGPSFTLPAFSRKSVDVSDTLPDSWSVSTSVTSDVPVVAERSMYLDTPATFRQAATDSIGVSAGATTWYLAEGCTGTGASGGFETWVLVQNPGTRTANARLTYMTPSGPVEGPDLVLPPMTRQSVSVGDTVPGAWDVSTGISSDAPVIAERAIYWSTKSCARQAATDSIGVTGAQKSWCLAEGCTGSNDEGSFETWVLIQNAGSSSATVTVTYMTTDGRVSGPTLTIEPNTRRTVNVAETIPGCWDVSTRVASDVPVIVERAMYWNSTGTIRQAAHDSIGVAQ